MKVQIQVEVEEETINDLIGQAFWGGSNYWIGDSKNYKNYDNFMIRAEEEEEYIQVTPDKVKKGVKIMAEQYPNHFSDMINENWDAITSDVLLQLICFEEIVYA